MARMSVGPLDAESVSGWLARALETAEDRVGSLSRTLWDRTQGNPFFLGQLLLTLHAKKLVFRDIESGAWQWDEAGIAAAPITDDVVELMASKVREPPEATLHASGISPKAARRTSCTSYD